MNMFSPSIRTVTGAGAGAGAVPSPMFFSPRTPVGLPRPELAHCAQATTPVRQKDQQIIIDAERGILIKPPRLKGHNIDLFVELIALRIASVIAHSLDTQIKTPTVSLIEHQRELALEVEILAFSQTLQEADIRTIPTDPRLELLIKTLIIDLVLLDNDGHIKNLAWMADGSGLYRYDFDLANSDKLVGLELEEAIDAIRVSHGKGFALRGLTTHSIADKVQKFSPIFNQTFFELISAAFDSEIAALDVYLTQDDHNNLARFKVEVLNQIQKLNPLAFGLEQQQGHERTPAKLCPDGPERRKARSRMFGEGSQAFNLDGSDSDDSDLAHPRCMFDSDSDYSSPTPLCSMFASASTSEDLELTIPSGSSDDEEKENRMFGNRG